MFYKFLFFLKTGILFNPIWICEKKLRSLIKFSIERAHLISSEKWLDVGCGLRPYECFFPLGSYIGVDIEVSGRHSALKAPDHFYDGRTLPFPDDSFDGVISTQVLEHVPDPWSRLIEMHRVIKPGGGLIFSVPFVWQEHEEPYDFFRFTQFGIINLLEKSGFEIESVIKDTGSIEALAVALNVYVVNNLIPPIRGVSYLFALGICFPIQFFALLFQRILPDRGQLYLNLVIRAKKSCTC